MKNLTAELARVLQDAVACSDEYKTLNNLSGDPYWVTRAKAVLYDCGLSFNHSMEDEEKKWATTKVG